MSDTSQAMVWSLGAEDTEAYQSGYLDLPYLPGKESLAERLEEVITRLDLLSKLYEAFPINRPARSWWAWWFGFWMDSPLNKQQCSVLRDLFTELSKKSPLYRDHIAPFLIALQLARDTDVFLHVKLGPPGHADFGWLTTFTHCPHCKVEAPLERWQDKYPDSPIECPVCGQVYSPAQTYSSRRFSVRDNGLRSSPSLLPLTAKEIQP